MKELNLEQHRLLVQSLIAGEVLGYPAKQCELIETHISSVIITPDRVYKLKKPVDLGFLDFSTLKLRRHYCDEELRLNRRLSRELYIDVLAIGGTLEQPVLSGVQDPIDYVVVMNPFDQDQQFDHLLQREGLERQHVVSLAEYIADFHMTAPRLDCSEDYGSVDHIAKPVRENFFQIREYCQSPELLKNVEEIERWSEEWLHYNSNSLLDRRSGGFIRECHGDLHCHNLAWHQGKPLAFDCIEFDPSLYWIDVISDVAFLLMDLQHEQRQDLAQAFLNRYLQITGDYAGLSLAPFYMVYRAMVRAKIEAITSAQAGIGEELKQHSENALAQYLNLAKSIMERKQAMLLLTHGPSASGKSTVASAISECLCAITIRSDAERKRLFDLKQNENHSTGYAEGIYNQESTQQTYQRMLELSRGLIKAGFIVINDATFSQSGQRQMFYDLADDLGCPLRVLELDVPESILRERIQQRKNDISDADIDVLEQQLKQWSPLQESETNLAVRINQQDESALLAVCSDLKSILISNQ